MARAHSIWVVIEIPTLGHGVWAAFTVKHELETWLSANRDRADKFRVLQFRDGKGNANSVFHLAKDFLED